MKGIDISNNNGDINFDNIVNSGIDVVYIKATEGTTFQDIYCQINYNMAKERNLKIGFYHFLVGSSSAITQARNFYNMIKGKIYQCKPCLDVEVYFDNLNNYIKDFKMEFKKLSGQDIIIYSGLYFSNDFIFDKSLPLWIANYTNRQWSYGNSLFNNIVGHQYTDKGKINDCDKNFDLNVFTNDILLDCEIVQNQEPVKIVGKVAEIQQLCNSLVGTNLVIDNIYGTNTDNTIKKLPLCSKNGYNKELTTWVQLRLGCRPDGVYGNETEKMVRLWQNMHHLTVDGIVGYYTLRSLCLT